MKIGLGISLAAGWLRWLAGWLAVIACSLGLQAARDRATQPLPQPSSPPPPPPCSQSTASLHDCRLFRWLVAFRISKWFNITIKLAEEQKHLKTTIPEF